MPTAVLDTPPAPARPGRRIIFNGEPGTKFLNQTDRVLWQLVPSMINTCGACFQYIMAIGPSWPIPIHHGCRCQQVRVSPYTTAPHAFVDFRELLDNMSRAAQVTAVGASNYALLKAKVVTWTEVVSRYRVKPLAEVLATNKISLETALKAGVKPGIANRAFGLVNTPAAEIARQHRAELVERIQAAGVSHETMVREMARVLTNRVTAAGPSGAAQTMASVGTPGGAGRVAAFAAALGGMKRGAVVKPKAEPKAEPKPAVAPEPSMAAIDAIHGDFEAASKAAFGHVLNEQEIANLAGLPNGKIYVETTERPDGAHNTVILTQSAIANVDRSVRITEGKTVLKANSFFVAEQFQGQGLGADVFGRMVEQAVKLGIDRIETDAVRGPTSNGYYTWPRFGYDGPLPEALRSGQTGTIVSLPESLAGAKRVSDLMKTPEGAAWWKEHGDTIGLTFDLAPGSQSRQVWAAYQAEKAASAATGSSTPTSTPPTSPPLTGPGTP